MRTLGDDANLPKPNRDVASCVVVCCCFCVAVAAVWLWVLLCHTGAPTALCLLVCACVCMWRVGLLWLYAICYMFIKKVV